MTTDSGIWVRIRGTTAEGPPSQPSQHGQRLKQAVDIVLVVVEVHAGSQIAVLFADDDALFLQRGNGRFGRLEQVEADEPGALVPWAWGAHADLTILRARDEPRGQLLHARLDVVETDLANELGRATLDIAAEEIGVAIFEAMAVGGELELRPKAVVRGKRELGDAGGRDHAAQLGGRIHEAGAGEGELALVAAGNQRIDAELRDRRR